MRHSDRPVYVLKLRPEPGGPADAVKLKRALKAVLRSYGLRCVSFDVVEVEDVRRVDQTAQPTLATSVQQSD